MRRQIAHRRVYLCADIGRGFKMGQCILHRLDLSRSKSPLLFDRNAARKGYGCHGKPLRDGQLSCIEARQGKGLSAKIPNRTIARDTTHSTLHARSASGMIPRLK